MDAIRAGRNMGGCCEILYVATPALWSNLKEQEIISKYSEMSNIFPSRKPIIIRDYQAVYENVQVWFKDVT